MKRFLPILLILVVATLAFAGGEGEAEGPASISTGPLEPYDPPLTITTWRREDNRTYPDGQSLTDNIWTRAIADELGINFEYVWTSPSSEMNAKINTSLAAGDLPDIMNKLNLEQYVNLARVGRLTEMTSIIDEYDVGAVNRYLDFGTGVTRDMLTINGELFGWGRGPQVMNVKMFAARGDWMEAVGYSELPQDVDEIIEFLYALSENDPDGNGQDDTYGLGASAGGGAAGFMGAGMPLEPFFAMYQSYPLIWVEDGGQLVYGSVMPETKEALEVLAQLHADGVMSPEWPVLGAWTEAPDEIAQEKVGAAFTQQWWHNWGGVTQSVNNNPGMEWQHTFPNDVSGNPYNVPITAQVTDINVVNSDFANPEALVKIYNLHYMKTTNEETADGDFHTLRLSDDTSISTFFYWADFFASHDVDKNPILANQVTEALQTGDPSSLGPEALGYYTGATIYLEGRGGTQGNDSGYGNYRTFGPGGSNELAWFMLENEGFILDAFQSFPTPAQATFAGDLRSTRNELFVQMIVGELDIDEGWNQWLAYWENNGGGEWTEEVNAWYAN